MSTENKVKMAVGLALVVIAVVFALTACADPEPAPTPATPGPTPTATPWKCIDLNEGRIPKDGTPWPEKWHLGRTVHSDAQGLQGVLAATSYDTFEECEAARKSAIN